MCIYINVYRQTTFSHPIYSEHILTPHVLRTHTLTLPIHNLTPYVLRTHSPTLHTPPCENAQTATAVATFPGNYFKKPPYQGVRISSNTYSEHILTPYICTISHSMSSEHILPPYSRNLAGEKLRRRLYIYTYSCCNKYIRCKYIKIHGRLRYNGM